MDLRDLGRTLLIFGGILVFVGAFFYFGGKLPFRLGKLPGDIYIRRGNFAFYFPLATCILLSIVATIFLSLMRR